MAERSYARLSRMLRHEFRDRKPIILYASHAHFQQTNALTGFIGEGTGGVTEALKSRVILPFTGSYPDFDHVLTHELVHAFQFDVIFRNGVMQEASPSLPRIPLWFMEGMAEYLAIGHIDPHTASWVRDAVLKGYIRSIPEMNRRDDYLSYRFGQSLWAYIGETWGDEVIGILLQKAPRLGVERAFVSTLGQSLDALSRAWLRSLRRAHLPEMTRHGTPDRFADRLTEPDSPGQPWYLAPALSADGERLVFASQRDGFFMDLWLADGRTGEVVAKLVTGSQSSGFESLRYQSSAGSFSPDGRLIAFAAQTGGRDALYLYDVERRRVWRKLTFDLDGVSNPSWSPDGSRLVFTGLDGGLSDLFISDLEGGLTRLTRDRYADLQPSWSPDGRTIAFSTDRGPEASLEHLDYGNVRVALLDVATGRIEVLPHQDRGKNINPVWSPDGGALAWVGDRTGINNLYVYDRGRRRLRQVTDLLTGIIGTNHLTPVLTWARTGRMVFVHFESAGYALYALDDPRALPTIRAWTDAPVVASRPSAAARAGGRTTGSGPASPPASEIVDAGAGPMGPGAGWGVPGAAADPGPSEGADGTPDTGSATPTVSLYRTADGFRPSAELPPPAATGSGPLSVMDLLEESELSLPDTSEFRVTDYDARLSADVIGRPTVGVQTGGYYGNGVYGGSFLALSDMLGDHNVVLAGNVNGSLSDAMFYGGYGFYKSRANLSVALQQLPLYRYRGFRSFPLEVDGETERVAANVFLRDVIRSANVTLAYPFSQFRRIEVGGRLAYFKRDHLYRGYIVESGRPLNEHERVGDLIYVEPSVALVFDNALFGWTGPVHGRRYRLQLSHTLGELDFTEALVDLRNYWNWRQSFVLATRLVGLARMGPGSNRFSLFWGGPYYIRGYDGNSYAPTSAECEANRDEDDPSPSLCPARDQLIGSSGAFLNTELRFPVITELRLGPLGQFPPVDGVVFFDAGLAWDERVCSTRDFDPTSACSGQVRDVSVVWRRDEGQNPYLVREPLYSWGVGIRLNVFYAILRLDYAFPLRR
ncbi:MAG: BamA/TamA family outer membrane protein, partial [Gemmatimonadota bacterium]